MIQRNIHEGKAAGKFSARNGQQSENYTCFMKGKKWTPMMPGLNVDENLHDWR